MVRLAGARSGGDAAGTTIHRRYAGLGITGGSTPVAVTLAAQRHLRIIGEIEPKLDDRDFLATLYPDGKVPSNPKPKWHYRHLDLALLDQRGQLFGVLERGPN